LLCNVNGILLVGTVDSGSKTLQIGTTSIATGVVSEELMPAAPQGISIVVAIRLRRNAL
jgi:hypothetical protein